jgi:Mg-chelatase subunit ChlD
MKKLKSLNVLLRCLWMTLLVLLSVSTTARAVGKSRLVIIVMDDSGSMQQTDPQRIRAEAAGMLARLLTEGDRFGVIAFGGDARWTLRPAQVGAGLALESALNLPAKEPRTDFAVPLQAAVDYISQQPPNVRESSDISLVLLTDGAPDPDPGRYPKNAAEMNRQEALQLSQRLASMGTRLYTIGLGRSVEADFLSNLAAAAHGLYAPARTADELRQAFLRVFTRVCGLPIYTAFDGSRQVHFDVGDRATRALVFLFRQDVGAELDIAATKLFETSHIAVFEKRKPGRHLRATILGPPSATSTMLAVEQPLGFELKTTLPAATLTNSDLHISAALLGGGGEPVWDRLFMQDAIVQLNLRSANGPSFVRALAPNVKGQVFEAVVQPPQTGDYDAVIELSSPFGEVYTHVGKVRISPTAASVPDQIVVEYPALPSFIPASWFATTTIYVPAVLPTGIARVHFHSGPTVEIPTPDIAVDPTRPATVKLALPNPTRLSTPVDITYETIWTDGQQEQRRTGVMVVVAHPVSLPTYLATRKLKVAGIICGLLLFLGIYRRFFVKPSLQGVLLVRTPGDPHQRRFEASGKIVSVYESSKHETNSGEKLVIATGRDRLLFTLRLVNQGGQWMPAIEPGKQVTISGPSMPKNRESVSVGELKIEFHNFRKV